MAREVLQIGAGRIGRGLNGAVVSESGRSITFADANQSLVDLINQQREYPVITVSAQGRKETVIRDVEAIHVLDEESFTRAVVEADLIFTAVGSNILSQVAPHLARGLVERIRKRPQDELHAVVVACENITDNTARLKQQVLQHVPEEYKRVIDERVSFPNCVVDRIVPNAAGSVGTDSPLAVTVEDYYQWVIDGTALRGSMPDVAGIEVSPNLQDILAQKLFTLNMAHAQVAYFGFRRGYEFIHDAVQDPIIRSLVTGALQEVETVLVHNNPSIDVDSQRKYAEKVLARFENPYLRDEVTRVARDPKRKLGQGDRLVTPALLACSLGEIPAHLATGVTAALTYNNEQDAQARELVQALHERGVEIVMQEVSHVTPDSPLGNLVRAGYHFDILRAR